MEMIDSIRAEINCEIPGGIIRQPIGVTIGEDELNAELEALEQDFLDQGICQSLSVPTSYVLSLLLSLPPLSSSFPFFSPLFFTLCSLIIFYYC